MVLNKIEKLRRKLYESIEKYGINSEQVREISNKIDELINIYNEKQIKYEEDNTMFQIYKKSLKRMKQIVIEFGEFVTVEEWNKIAREEDLLNSEAIKYISQLNWNELREKIIYEANKKIF